VGIVYKLLPKESVLHSCLHFAFGGKVDILVLVLVLMGNFNGRFQWEIEQLNTIYSDMKKIDQLRA
jgi:hypothetical protein